MTNKKVIDLFLKRQRGQTPKRDITNGVYYYKGHTLRSTGKTLVNYSTIIAFWEDDYIIVNMRKYSRTTSKIQSQLLNAIKEAGIIYIMDGIRG